MAGACIDDWSQCCVAVNGNICPAPGSLSRGFDLKTQLMFPSFLCFQQIPSAGLQGRDRQQRQRQRQQWGEQQWQR